jgi:uncharacterized repeat protein (TIGR02543 family)
VVDISATPAAGYQFVNWTGEVANPNSASTTITMNANKTATANFSVIQRTLTMAVSPGAGGTTTPGVGAHDYNDGTVVDISATPAAGYQFVNWTGEVANPNSASTTITMNANKTATANFSVISVIQRTLTMAVSPDAGGTTTPGVGAHDYNDGTVVDISATPAAGYQFVSWTGEVANLESASTTITMNANKTATAVFIKDSAVKSRYFTEVPKEYRLLQNYPNPFNPSTSIIFQLPKTVHVTVDVYNSSGQLIRTLVDETKPTGTYETIWNGKDNYGNSVGSGIYYYQIRTKDLRRVMKMMYIR